MHDDRVHEYAGKGEDADLRKFGLENVPVEVIRGLEYQNWKKNLEQSVLLLENMECTGFTAAMRSIAVSRKIDLKS